MKAELFRTFRQEKGEWKGKTSSKINKDGSTPKEDL